MTKITNINTLVTVITLFLIVACNSKKTVDSYVSISKSSWHKDNVIRFDFYVSDTISKRNLYINIRNNNHYNFSNLFLIARLQFPDGQSIIDTLEYKMTDVTGKFLGNGAFNIKENKLFYKEDKKFPKLGKYIFEVSQAMRKNGEVDGVTSLEGITDVGFSIENIIK